MSSRATIFLTSALNCNIYPSAKYVLEFLRKMELPKLGSRIYLGIREPGSRVTHLQGIRRGNRDAFELVAQANYMWNVAFGRSA